MALVSIWRDKLYEYWGYASFEQYAQSELGLKKSVAMNIVKNYSFTEDWAPQLLDETFLATCTPEQYPDMDKMALLRKAKSNKFLKPDDYRKIENDILEKHIPVQEVKKDLTALIKERKEVDGNESREQRNSKSAKKFVHNAKSFATEAGVLKVVPADLLKRLNDIIADVEGFIDA
jgi:hypothetical protein